MADIQGNNMKDWTDHYGAIPPDFSTPRRMLKQLPDPEAKHVHQYTIAVESETTHEVDFIKEGEYREYDQTIVTVLRCQCGEETTR